MDFSLKKKSFHKLFHVGSLNPDDKALQYKQSLEGSGLSVSECPKAWIQIARLGGSPTWELVKDGNSFLDYHELCPEELAAIAQWGLSREWVKPVEVWVYEYVDEEMAEKRYTEFASEAEALSESSEDDNAVVFKRTGLQALPKLIRHAGYHPEPMLVPDLLSVAFAEHELNLDGVFWDDTDDPDAYSAPRAVIVSSRIADWRKTKI